MKNLALLKLMISVVNVTVAQTLFVPSGSSGIGSSGNSSVGLGISSPQSILHISNSGNNLLKIQSTTGGLGNTAGIDFCTYSTPSSRVARIEAVDKGSFNGDLAFYTDGDGIDNSNTTEKMRISMNGNVGVGTSTPDGMQVNVPLGSEASQGTNNIRMGVFGGTPRLILDSGGNTPFEIDNNAGQLRFFTPGFVKMVINSNGNVGIGTASPDAMLAVAGQVHAQEVKVSITVPGPDYVFEKEYKLTSLDDIKTYIDQNKHLPEVPSAKEMEKNGVQLGEMNMLLLKKIEELTLYVIEQNKKLEVQSELIVKQNDRINKLENHK